MTDAQLNLIFKDEPELLTKIEKFRGKKLLDKDPLVRWCTRAGCEGWVKANSFKASKVHCTTCQQAICFKCRDDWHGRCTSCEKNQERKSKLWGKQDLKISYCPKCRTRVEKAEGCNHMTCYYCQFQWCWICGGTYTDDHYVPMNPFGCGNQQYAEKKVWYIQIWIQLGWLLLSLIMIPLFIAFIVPVGLIALTFEKPLRPVKRKCCKKIHYFLLGLVLGIMLFSIGMTLNLVAIPLMIACGIPMLCCVMVHKRWKIHSRANRNLQEIKKGERSLYNRY